LAQAKCLIVTTHYRPLIGGALTVYDALASHANGAVSVLTASHDYVAEKEVEGWKSFDQMASYKVTRLPFMRIGLLPAGVSVLGKIQAKIKAWKLSRKVLRATLALIEADDIDVVCIGAQDALGWLVEPLKQKTDAKVIIYVHGEEVSQGAHSPKAEEQRRTALQKADGVIAVSSFTADILRNRYHVPKEKILLQTNGVDLARYNGHLAPSMREPMGLPQGRFVFSCGRLVERKGFDMLVEAWPEIHMAVPDVTLVIGGSGPLELALKARITTLGISDSVKMLGWMSEEKMAAAYGFADVFAMPNRTMPDGDTEGFGLVFLEAAAMGTPSVGGKAGGAVDAIVDGETGLFVDGNKPEKISAALTELLTNKALCDTLALKSQAHAQTQGWQKKTDDFLAYLNQISS